MTEIATFGGGCFWGVQKLYEQHFVRNQAGGLSTRSGYMGGGGEQTTYEEVCKGDSGHIEVVEVVFDPARVSYAELVEFFWRTHESTEKGRKFWVGEEGGPGNQYQSVVFYHSPEQLRVAQDVFEKVKLEHPDHLAGSTTQFLPAQPFHTAEEYHQNFLDKEENSHWVCERHSLFW